MDLNRAEQRRDAKKQIAAILKGLDSDDGIVVLEDLLADAHDLSNRKPAVFPKAAAIATRSSTAFGGAQRKLIGIEPPEEAALWKRIEEYCLAHPTVDGIYTAREVGRALGLAENPTLASTFAGSAVKRKSTNSDRTVKNPRFVWIGDGAGKFRLLERPGTKGATEQSS